MEAIEMAIIERLDKIANGVAAVLKLLEKKPLDPGNSAYDDKPIKDWTGTGKPDQ